LLSVAGGQALQGGVVASFADGIAGLAVGDAVQGITPIFYIRVDDLRPPTTDLRANAEVTYIAASVGRADVDVSGTDGALVATACAIYKVGEEPNETPWMAID
jgi:acyl-coenzyme A thioesterase PaaI-like protein